VRDSEDTIPTSGYNRLITLSRLCTHPFSGPFAPFFLFFIFYFPPFLVVRKSFSKVLIGLSFGYPFFGRQLLPNVEFCMRTT
jgi:hypothetical protein